MLLALKAVAISSLVAVAVALGGVSARAQAAPPDFTSSPAGPVIGTIVIFSPTFARTGTAQPGILTVTPTSVGSLVVPVPLPIPPVQAPVMLPVQVPIAPVRPPAISGAGATLTQFQVIVPGPNPAQNTPIALGQLLNLVLRPLDTTGTTGPGSIVSVYATTP